MAVLVHTKGEYMTLAICVYAFKRFKCVWMAITLLRYSPHVDEFECNTCELVNSKHLHVAITPHPHSQSASHYQQTHTYKSIEHCTRNPSLHEFTACPEK